ncbi:MAG: aminotransferase class V-fold PLP-dependent enzyme [Stigonema ocellatum SAG 48.90 = DSM 106950]|nr:aminotransferase class V-fold PLP-dependent enzyme [Stigonema ocellatum SAG 48.90 = DSM 106950]
MPKQVLDAIISHLKKEAEIGGYEAAKLSHDAVEHVYDGVSELIGCQRHEIAIIENATRAWDMAFYAIPFKSGDRILTSVSEYGSNYIAFLQIAQRTGAVIEVIPNDDYGQVSITALKNLISERVKLIAITHIPTNSGLINPAVEIGKVAKQANVLYLLDACQSVGQMPINVQTIGCDILSGTGRKYLRGPRGTGFLYVRQNVIEQLEPPFLDSHAAQWVTKDQFKIRTDARRFENWETNYAGKVGLGVAVDYALSWGLENVWARISSLAKMLRTHLSNISHVKLQDVGLDKCGIVAFTVDGHNPQHIYHQLAKQKINVSVSQAASTRLDMEKRGLESVVRASVHYYNTEDEIQLFCEAITRIISQTQVS